MNDIEILREKLAAMENDAKVPVRHDDMENSISNRVNESLALAKEIRSRTLAMIGFITGNRPDPDNVPNPECLEQAVNWTCGMLKGTVENLDVIMKLLGV